MDVIFVFGFGFGFRLDRNKLHPSGRSPTVSVLPWADAEQLFQSLSECKAYQTVEVIEVISQDALNFREDPPTRKCRRTTSYDPDLSE